MAAALCAALPVAAFATGILKVDPLGQVQLDRFASGIAVDENGANIATGDQYAIGEDQRPNEFSGYVDPSQVQEIEGQRVITPSQTEGVQLAVEEDRVMLYYLCGSIDEERDITEELRQNGGYTVRQSQPDGCRVIVTVYASDEENALQAFEGTYYRVKMEGWYSPEYTGTHHFTADVPSYASGNNYQAREPLDD